jgi:hypothetical protein
MVRPNMKRFDPSPYRRIRKTTIRSVSISVVTLAFCGLAIASPAYAAHEGFSRTCKQPIVSCIIWPGYNNGVGAYGYGRPYYYTTGNNNKNQTIICAITPSGWESWEWSYWGTGTCTIGGKGTQTNVSEVRLPYALPESGVNVGGLAYWCDSNGCS